MWHFKRITHEDFAVLKLDDYTLVKLACSSYREEMGCIKFKDGHALQNRGFEGF